MPRTRNVVATADHFDGGFYILTNLDAPDYRIMRAEDGATAIEQWTEVVPEVSGRYISNFAIFRDYISHRGVSRCNPDRARHRSQGWRQVPVGRA